MDLAAIVNNITEEKFEHTVDVLIAETEADERCYSEIMDACLNLKSIISKAPQDDAFEDMLKVLTNSALARMAELRLNVESSMELNDLLHNSEYADSKT